MNKTNATPSREDAIEALRREEKERVAAANKEIKDVLDKYNVRLDVRVILRENSVAPEITVVSR